MKFAHLVKHNGKFYKAGEEVPISVQDANTVNDSAEVNASQPEVEVAETVKKQYTKTEINRLSTNDLKKIAKENGVDSSLSGAEIKKLLVEKFGL